MVCVHDQTDWEMIYRNPSLRIQCIEESCTTLLSAKRMDKSGLRFFAVRKGGCSHAIAEITTHRDDIAQDPSTLVGGGGPEGDEHLWMKGRLHRIAKSLGYDSRVEDPQTHGDVFLPEPQIVLEYQRWVSDFRKRTRNRSHAGASKTLWFFPWQQPGKAQTKTHKAFNREVFRYGGIYVAVRHKDTRELQKPWESASQERTARLYASGSIVDFNKELRALVHTEHSLATILKQIVEQKRVLARVPVRRRTSGETVTATAWVLRDDLARLTTLQPLNPPVAARQNVEAAVQLSDFPRLQRVSSQQHTSQSTHSKVDPSRQWYAAGSSATSEQGRTSTPTQPRTGEESGLTPKPPAGEPPSNSLKPGSVKRQGREGTDSVRWRNGPAWLQALLNWLSR